MKRTALCACVPLRMVAARKLKSGQSSKALFGLGVFFAVADGAAKIHCLPCPPS
jgi:hypothetical protein